MLSSLADETPEGRSIVELAEERYGLAPREIPDAELVAFTAQTRMSGVDFDGPQHPQGRGRLGAALGRGARRHRARRADGRGRRDRGPRRHAARRRDEERRGREALGVIYLKDTVKPGMSERFDELRAMGIRTVMITGDNPLTAGVIAAGGRRRRLHRRGHARRQDGLHQGASRPGAGSSR